MECILFQAKPRNNSRFLAALPGYAGATTGAVEASSERNEVSSVHKVSELRT
jgi:hypothetical protein